MYELTRLNSINKRQIIWFKSHDDNGLICHDIAKNVILITIQLNLKELNMNSIGNHLDKKPHKSPWILLYNGCFSRYFISERNEQSTIGATMLGQITDCVESFNFLLWSYGKKRYCECFASRICVIDLTQCKIFDDDPKTFHFHVLSLRASRQTVLTRHEVIENSQGALTEQRLQRAKALKGNLLGAQCVVLKRWIEFG